MDTKLYDLKNIIVELLYLSNYFSGINFHTWSLAIEEQFYILLALFVFVLLKLKSIDKKALVMGALIIWILTVFVGRAFEAYQYKDEITWHYLLPHYRIDGIMLGVLFSYVYSFTNYYCYIKKYRLPILILSAIAVLLPFVFEVGNYLFNSYGILAMNVGFAFFVLFAFDFNEYVFIINQKLFKVDC